MVNAMAWRLATQRSLILFQWRKSGLAMKKAKRDVKSLSQAAACENQPPSAAGHGVAEL